MKRNIVLVFFLVISSMAALSSHAQTKQLTEVSVDLGSGVTTGPLGLPFDVPFRIKGPTTTSFRKISLTYQVSKSYPDSNKLQWKGNAFTRPSTWSYMGDQEEWRLPVGPIHPNVPYDFKFTVTRIPDAEAPEKDKFKQEAYRILEAFYADPAGIDPGTITATNKELNIALKALIPPGQNIIYPDGTPYAIDMNDMPFNKLLQNLKEIKFRQLQMATDQATVREILTQSSYDTFRIHLKTIINDTSLLTKDSRAILDGVVDAGNPKYKTIKMIDIGKIASQPNHRINEVFEGKLTLNSNSWAFVQRPDIDLMQLVYQFYYRLMDNLDKKAGKKAFAKADIDTIKLLLNFLKDIMDTQTLLFNDQLPDTKNAVLDRFPDVLADKFISATYIINDQSYIDAVSQSTPYIGLDVGFSYIPGYNQLFIYEGVNFYFMPVNKDAPLSYFNKRRYWWLKRLSVHFGLTQNLIKVENKRYVPLIEGVGSVIAGAGLRFNRIMRLNAGYMFFYEKDNNPLKGEKHFTALPQFSFTFDINIAKALGGFGRKLNIGQ